MAGLSAAGFERHQVFDSTALVWTQLERDGDQAVALADPRCDGAAQAASHQAGDVLVGDPREVCSVGVDLERELEDLWVPIVLNVGAAGEFAHESFDLITEALERLQVLALEPDLYGHADRRAGFDLLDHHASRRDQGGQLSLELECERFCLSRVAGVNQNLRVVGRGLFRDDREPETRPAGTDEGCVGIDLGADQTLDGFDRFHRLGLGLANGRAFGQEHIDGQDIVQVFGEEIGADQGQQAQGCRPRRRGSRRAQPICAPCTIRRSRCTSGRNASFCRPRRCPPPCRAGRAAGNFQAAE